MMTARFRILNTPVGHMHTRRRLVGLIAKTVVIVLIAYMASCLIFYTVHCTRHGTIAIIMNTITATTPTSAVFVSAIVYVA